MIKETLQKIEIFKDLDNESLEHLTGVCEIVEMRQGEVVIEENSFGDSLYIIQSGRVEIQFGSYENNSYQDICQIGELQVFGELSLIDGERRSARSTLVENSVLIVIPRRELLDLCESNPKIGYKIMFNLARVVVRRLRYTNMAVRHRLFN
jgi:CRP-like cAMP-binding protein